MHGFFKSSESSSDSTAIYGQALMQDEETASIAGAAPAGRGGSRDMQVILTRRSMLPSRAVASTWQELRAEDFSRSTATSVSFGQLIAHGISLNESCEVTGAKH
jgi:hypothetical protein